MIKTVIDCGPTHGVRRAAAAFGVSRSTVYRRRTQLLGPKPKRRSPARRISDVERALVLRVLHEPRFVDLAPAEVYAVLRSEGRYLCSVRSMHRILAAQSEGRERRRGLRHRNDKKPELLATKPNELWSWDITKLLGPAKWTDYYLYVILDVYSRMVVGWMIAHRESATLAERLIKETCKREAIAPAQLTIHADRGSSMTSKAVALMMADLGVTKTHSRPYVSDDNAYSEAQFKTLKYRPDFPDRFGSIQDARSFCVDFFGWYNEEHHHSGLAMLTPSDVHHGRVEARVVQAQATLDAAYAANPERFVHGRPIAKRPPNEVWINKPTPVKSVPEENLDTRTLP